MEASMEPVLKALLLTALDQPENQTPRFVLADWLEEHGHRKALQIRKHCESGYIHFRGYTLSGDGVGDHPGIVHLALQLVPHEIAVEFGCRCACHVLPRFEREFPEDDRPRQLAAIVRQWLDGEVTKREVLRVKDATAEAAHDEIAMQSWDQSWTAEQTAARLHAVSAALAVVKVAIAVSFPATSDKWEQYVSEALVDAISAIEDRASEKEWQRREFLTLLQQTN
jgi:uncharacterized protein (TIGR02996 family)